MARCAKHNGVVNAASDAMRNERRIHPSHAVYVRIAKPKRRTRARTSSNRRDALEAPTLARACAGCEDSKAAGFLLD